MREVGWTALGVLPLLVMGPEAMAVLVVIAWLVVLFFAVRRTVRKEVKRWLDWTEHDD